MGHSIARDLLTQLALVAPTFDKTIPETQDFRLRCKHRSPQTRQDRRCQVHAAVHRCKVIVSQEDSSGRTPRSEIVPFYSAP